MLNLKRITIKIMLNQLENEFTSKLYLANDMMNNMDMYCYVNKCSMTKIEEMYSCHSDHHMAHMVSAAINTIDRICLMLGLSYYTRVIDDTFVIKIIKGDKVAMVCRYNYSMSNYVRYEIYKNVIIKLHNYFA